jgi:hypothetical protein
LQTHLDVFDYVTRWLRGSTYGVVIVNWKRVAAELNGVNRLRCAQKAAPRLCEMKRMLASLYCQGTRADAPCGLTHRLGESRLIHAGLGLCEEIKPFLGSEPVAVNRPRTSSRASFIL